MKTDNQQDYWNRVADTKIFTHPINMELLGCRLHRDSVIVDYGCGYGRLVKTLNESGFNNVIGLDTSSALVNRGKSALVPNLFFIDDPENILVENGTVDCILLFAVLTCIPSNKAQIELIALLHSKLKPGGMLYISDYYLQDNSSEMVRYEYFNDDPDNFGVFTLPEGATFRHHTREWISSLLAAFETEYETNIEVKTMNGYAASAFQRICKKNNYDLFALFFPGLPEPDINTQSGQMRDNV